MWLMNKLEVLVKDQGEKVRKQGENEKNEYLSQFMTLF